MDNETQEQLNKRLMSVDFSTARFIDAHCETTPLANTSVLKCTIVMKDGHTYAFHIYVATAIARYILGEEGMADDCGLVLAAIPESRLVKDGDELPFAKIDPNTALHVIFCIDRWRSHKESELCEGGVSLKGVAFRDAKNIEHHRFDLAGGFAHTKDVYNITMKDGKCYCIRVLKFNGETEDARLVSINDDLMEKTITPEELANLEAECEIYRKRHSIRSVAKEAALATRAAEFKRTVRWSDEDNCYVGSLPELCGDCCDAQTVMDVLHKLDEIAFDYASDEAEGVGSEFWKKYHNNENNKNNG